MAECVLALDLGTTGARALLVDSQGAVLARCYRRLEVRTPHPGWVEQDPDEMARTSLALLPQVLERAGRSAADVAAIGVVTQRSTTLAWDRETGRPLAPAISWQDQRTVERVAGFRAQGLPLNTLASATKFEWWLEHDAAVRSARASGRLCLGTPDAWLTWNLSGGQVHVTDPGHASCTALFDLGAGDWSPPLLDLFGVDARSLPGLARTSGVVGETPASLLGVSVPVAARAGDQQAAAFAQGVHLEGQSKLTLGTSAMLDRHSGQTPADFAAGCYPLALWQLAEGPLEFCREATVITAGAALEGWIELGLASDPEEIDRLAASVSSSDGVVFVPALQGLGSPWLDDRARGWLGGLTRGSGRGELARALLDGIAQRCVDLCGALEVSGPLPVDGGLARSNELIQAIANLLGEPLLRARESETTALGCAFLAGLAVGVWSERSDCAPSDAPERFEPRMSASLRRRARGEWSRAIERARGASQA